MAGELEEFLGSALQWDHWTLSIVNMVTRVAALVNEKVLALPIEIHITSVNGELLLRSLLQADANGKPFGPCSNPISPSGTRRAFSRLLPWLETAPETRLR